MNFTAIAQARPNIALIKYWGKRDIAQNLPAVSSLSITLDTLWTRTHVQFRAGLECDQLVLNGTQRPDMLARVSRCLDSVGGPARPRAAVDSECNYPVAAGLASSSSAFAALVVAAAAALGRADSTLELARLAGAASGSAARSLYGGFVELRAGDRNIDLQQLLNADDWPLSVVVAITESGPKAVGSTDAMLRSAKTSPFYSKWLADQDEDLQAGRAAVLNKDFAQLAAVAEHNCLKMHSVMWSSRPPLVYWNSTTVACMEAVRALQREGEAVFFTIDAGPQLKAVCLPESRARVEAALAIIPGVQQLMHSALGAGACLVAA